MELGEYLPFWKKLTEAEQRTLAGSVQRRRLEKGQVLHHGSDECTGLILTLNGQLRVYTISDEGKELTLYRLLERDLCIFSAPCMVKSILFDVIVEAEQDTEILHIPVDVYRDLMDNSAAVANYTNELMAERFSDVMWLMDQVLNKKIDSRLAAFLLEESGLDDSRKLSITHDQIARHMGTAREVITRMLKAFQADGLVKLNRGGIELLNEKRLTELAADSLR